MSQKRKESAKVKKIREGWEKAPYCFCRLLGRVPAIATPKLGRSWCHTCGKPTS